MTEEEKKLVEQAQKVVREALRSSTQVAAGICAAGDLADALGVVLRNADRMYGVLRDAAELMSALSARRKDGTAVN